MTRNFPYILRFRLLIWDHCACIPESTSASSDGASWGSRDMLRWILRTQWTTLEMLESWRTMACTVTEWQKVFVLFINLCSVSKPHKGDDDPLEHAVNLNIFGRGPRTSRHSTFSQVASDRQRLREVVSERDEWCVVTDHERAVCQASHITPFASEDAVSLLPIYHTAHLRLPVNPIDCGQPPKLR